MSIRTNVTELVQISVMGEVAHPGSGAAPYNLCADTGEVVVLTGSSGITYNVRVGDSATRWAADHVEPAVSIKNKEGDGQTGPNGGLNVLACVGNRARVVSGKADGATGVVTGKHGGAERVMVDFTPEVMEKMIPGDKVLIRAWGVGQKLLDYPSVRVFNTDPDLLAKWGIEESQRKLRVPVAKVVPAGIMGSGLGRDNVYRGDYDITMFDPVIRDKYGLDDLRLGDLVAIMDADHTYGRIYRTGAVSVGIVIHGNSVVAGHGPGVTSLMSSTHGDIEPVITPSANIALILGLRNDIC